MLLDPYITLTPTQVSRRLRRVKNALGVSWDMCAIKVDDVMGVKPCLVGSNLMV